MSDVHTWGVKWLTDDLELKKTKQPRHQLIVWKRRPFYSPPSDAHEHQWGT